MRLLNNEMDVSVWLLLIIGVSFLPLEIYFSYAEDKNDLLYSIQKETKFYTNDGHYIDDFNFAAAGDCGCNQDARDTAINMIETDPEIVVGLGDYSYEKT